MKISLLEFFHSIQGEGQYAGTPMTFLRFPGCNMRLDTNYMCKAWDGALFRCDTDLHVHPTEYELDWIVRQIWEQHICITGGEPFLPARAVLLKEVCERLSAQDKILHFETNGTLPLPEWVENHYVACSPKAGFLPDTIRFSAELRLLVSDEILPHNLPDVFRAHHNVFLSPVSTKLALSHKHVAAALDSLRHFPHWRLSVQLHKCLKVK